MEARVEKLERDMGDIKAAILRLEPLIIRIDATVPHLATKAELGDITAALAEKPGKAYLWAILGVLIAAYGAGLAALAILK